MSQVYLSDIGRIEEILGRAPDELHGAVIEYLAIRRSEEFGKIVGLIENERTRTFGCDSWAASGFEGKFKEIRSMVSRYEDRTLANMVSSGLGVHQTVNSIESICDTHFPVFFVGAVLLGAIVASIGVYKFAKYLSRKNITFAKTF